MKSETPLDYAVFSLSPRRSRCELLVTSDGITEKLASGLLKPFATHLKVAEEQVASAVQSIKLEAERCDNAEAWFTKGTLERFVRFVSTPEVLELVNTFDVEMSQLEAARKIYSQGVGDHHSNASGGDGMGATAAADATKKELLRAIDVRLVALKQDLITACARASAAGFNPDTVSGLQHFANQFGAYRLKEACAKFLKVWQRRPDLITWKPDVDDKAVRSSTGSDMSIDDPTGPVPDVAQAQQPRSINAQLGSSESDTEKQNKEDSHSLTESSSSLIQKSQPGRRLSVQDRINMFESKQKENSGGKPVVAKPAELRRLSSDVSSGPGPAVVLRRWSGASDMSIDVSGEKKDSAESPLCTPSSSSSVSQARSNVFSGKPEDKNQKGLNHSGIFVDCGLKDEAESQTQNQLVKEDEVGLKGHANRKEQQSGSQAHLRGFGGRVEQLEVNDHAASLENEERSGGIKDQPSSVTKLKGLPDVGVKNPSSSQTKIVSSGADRDDSWQKHQRLSQTHIRHPQSHFRSLSGQLDGGFGLKFREFQDKDIEGDIDQLLPQPQWNKDLGSSEKQAAKAEDSGVPRMKFKKRTPAGPEQIKKSQGQRDDDSYLSESSKQGFLGTRVLENDDSFGTPREHEHVQRVRQSKGNQDANDELKMKANELEKLFAEHKLRVPGDQSGSARRGKSADTHLEQPVSFQYKNPAVPAMSPVQLAGRNTMIEPSGSSGNMNFKTPPVKTADNQDYGDIPRPKSSDCGFALDSKGKFYERYMLKRNAKLKEEWGSNREEKEAKMKAMRDNLEQSNAELKAKLSDEDKSVSARRRAEKLRSFNARSNWKRDQLIDSMQSEEDEDLTEFLVHKSYGQDRPFSETFFSDAGSRSFASKKNFPPRIASSTPRTATAPIPRSSVKSSNPGSGRRKVQVENPLAQSVPNFSDIRKENTKPFSGIGKMTTRSQVRNYTRNKSANEEITLAKEEKTRRQQSVRKSTGNPVEFKDASPMNSDDIAVGPLKEQTESSLYDTFSRHVDSKPFLRRGNGIGPGSGASVAKLKASMASEMREEEFDELPFDEENSGVKEEEEEELENATADDYDDMDNEKPSQESDKLGDSGSENGDSIRSLSQVDFASVPELPAPVPSTFHHIGSLQDSPGESPISWNSRMHHPFSFQHEMSDIDASADSPMGSPASWNSHSLAQTDADAARMRKKWGSAQKPILVSNSSHNQSRKDMTKGFKRLLKFGRKKSGTDSLVDWISATTSEGDDDMEDGRDPANRSSDDLRKSRMGFSHGHPSDDGFNDSELFNEQVQDLHSSIPAPPANFRLREDHISGSSLKAPRSFFSLSSFRSKGSDSKPR